MADFSFFIYDYESFGIDPARDRPAQFAGIRTDQDFNIIGEPVMFYCKQSNDYLPHPQAVMVTGITPQLCNEQGLDEPEFAARILAEFSRPNTCTMGYNNIRYDDEMTRYTFFFFFFDPYEYSWKNSNSRWDLLDVLRACYALRPEGINWVYDENGLPSFKLENLTKVNGIAHENAHDAMADVYATIAMAKLVKEKQPRLFDYFFNLRNKRAVEKLIDTANMTPLVHVSGMLGNYRGNTALVAPLAWHPSNSNAVIVCDLSADLSDLLALDVETLKVQLYSKKSDLEQQNLLPVPLKLVHINKCPILAPGKTLLAQSALRLGIDREQCLQNQQQLQQSADIRDKVSAIFSEQRTFAADINIETALYDDFFSDADKRNLQILRGLDAEQLKNPDLTFEDKRIPDLLFHYRARHFYRSLNRGEQIKWQKYRQTKLAQGQLAFEQDLQELAALHHDNPEKMALLQQLYEYAEKLFA